MSKLNLSNAAAFLAQSENEKNQQLGDVVLDFLDAINTNNDLTQAEIELGKINGMVSQTTLNLNPESLRARVCRMANTQFEKAKQRVANSRKHNTGK